MLKARIAEEERTMKKQLKEQLAEDDKILALYLFGSRSTGNYHDRSDTDLAMLLRKQVPEDNYSEYRLKYLSKLREFFTGDLDFVILNQVPPILQFQVLKDGQLLYDPSPDERALMQVKMLNRYYLSKPFYNYHFDNLKDRIKEQGLGYGQKSNRSAAEEARRLSEKLAALPGSEAD